MQPRASFPLQQKPLVVSVQGAALLADLNLMHTYDQVVISTLGVDDQMRLAFRSMWFCDGAAHMGGDFARPEEAPVISMSHR